MKHARLWRPNVGGGSDHFGRFAGAPPGSLLGTAQRRSRFRGRRHVEAQVEPSDRTHNGHLSVHTSRTSRCRRQVALRGSFSDDVLRMAWCGACTHHAATWDAAWMECMSCRALANEIVLTNSERIDLDEFWRGRALSSRRRGRLAGPDPSSPSPRVARAHRRRSCVAGPVGSRLFRVLHERPVPRSST
jgi:hypothetical protein